jgi:hypothetical protein
MFITDGNYFPNSKKSVVWHAKTVYVSFWLKKSISDSVNMFWRLLPSSKQPEKI